MESGLPGEERGEGRPGGGRALAALPWPPRGEGQAGSEPGRRAPPLPPPPLARAQPPAARAAPFSAGGGERGGPGGSVTGEGGFAPPVAHTGTHTRPPRRHRDIKGTGWSEITGGWGGEVE